MIPYRPLPSACALLALLLACPALAQDPTAPGAATARTERPTLTPLAHIEQRGDGPIPMVLIPGTNCDWTVFDSFMDRNGARYTMYAVTLPGFGGSEPPPAGDGPTSWLANATRAVASMIEAKGLEKPVLVGHGLGGHLALRLAVEYPAVPRAIVTLDGPPMVPLGSASMAATVRAALVDDTIRNMRNLDDEAWLASQRRNAFGMVYDARRATELGDLFCGVERDVSIQYTGEYLAADLRRTLGRIQAPVLVIVPLPGAKAPEGLITVIRETWAVNFNSATDVTIEFFDDTLHFLQDDRPEKLDRVIAAHLREELREELREDLRKE